MAQEASVDVVQAVTYTGVDDDGTAGEAANVYRQLMGDGPAEGVRSFGMVNPAIADSLGDVAARNLDALGGNASVNQTRIGPDGGVEIAEDDRGRVFTLVNTDPGAAEDLNTQVGVHQADQLRQAIEADDDGALQRAAESNGNLEGYMNAGVVNADLIAQRLGYEVDMEDYQDARQAAGIAKSVAMGGLSLHPVGAMTAPLANEAGDMLIDELITPPEDPSAHDVDDASDNQVLATRAAYDYLQARQEITGEGVGSGSGLTDENGDLLPWDELSADDKTALRTESGVGVYTDPQFFDPAGRFDEASLDEQGIPHAESVEAHLDGKQ